MFNPVQFLVSCALMSSFILGMLPMMGWAIAHTRYQTLPQN